MIEKEKFERHLIGLNLSENTIASYQYAIKQFSEQYGDVTQKNLRSHKVWLIENYKPKTEVIKRRITSSACDGPINDTIALHFSCGTILEITTLKRSCVTG